MIKNLDILEKNRFQIETQGKNIFIHFFKPGKFSNAFVEYNERGVHLEKKGNSTCLSSQIPGPKNITDEDDYDIKLYLPDAFSYDLNIDNHGGKAKVENGSHFTNLEITSRIVKLINVSAPSCGNIIVYPLMMAPVNLSFVPKNSALFEKLIEHAKTYIYLENSNINTLVKHGGADGPVKIHLNHSQLQNINIIEGATLIMENDSIIKGIKSTDYLKCYAKDSEINDIKCNDYTTLSFENVNVGSISGNREVALTLSNCHFMEEKDIILKKDSHATLYFGKEQEYKQKGKKELHILDNNKKLMKIKAKSYVRVSEDGLYMRRLLNP